MSIFISLFIVNISGGYKYLLVYCRKACVELSNWQIQPSSILHPATSCVCACVVEEKSQHLSWTIHLYSNDYARIATEAHSLPQNIALPPVSLNSYLSVWALLTKMKKDPVEDGRSNRKVTAVDGTIEASLGTGESHKVRWGLSDYCLHQKRWSVHLC